MVASTTAFLVAGRFGLAPTVNRPATAGLDLKERDAGVKSGDPAGVLRASAASYDAQVAACHPDSIVVQTGTMW